MEKLEIAKILKPQALKGELKLELYLKDENFFKGLSEVFIDGKVYKVLNSVVRQGFGYIMLDGIDDCNKAELLRGKIIVINKEDAPELNEGEYLIGDMLGLSVVDDAGEEYGKIVNIEQYGSADVYTVHGRRGELIFPFIKGLVKTVDLDNKVMVVYKNRLDEVLV